MPVGQEYVRNGQANATPVRRGLPQLARVDPAGIEKGIRPARGVDTGLKADRSWSNENREKDQKDPEEQSNDGRRGCPAEAVIRQRACAAARPFPASR